ncbi:hypothetical protein HanRHA438_Chr09g0393451 [Helianthus annuus]|nr:hypothetical protein HanRHA438_Chr09g0393451 [Helianthus annuus]
MQSVIQHLQLHKLTNRQQLPETYCMNSGSDSIPAIVSGDNTTSKSTLPPPSLPGNAEIFPSNLFARPLLTATGFPHPKSLSNIGNLGELPIVSIAPSKFPNGKHRGSLSQFLTKRHTIVSSCDNTFLFNCSAHHFKSFDNTSPAVACVGMLCIAFPK